MKTAKETELEKAEAAVREAQEKWDASSKAETKAGAALLLAEERMQLKSNAEIKAWIMLQAAERVLNDLRQKGAQE